MGRRLFLLSLLALLLAACGPHWKVVKQASPNPFSKGQPIVLEQASFEGLMVKDRSERDFKADRSPEANDKWEADKRTVADAFSEALIESGHATWQRNGPPDAVRVRPHVTNMHGGVSMGIGSTAAHIEMTVQLVKGDLVLDEITTEADYQQGESGSVGGVALGGYSGSDRLTHAATKCGKYVADYLEKRID